jgi:MinD superfamily P-loop ATPase
MSKLVQIAVIGAKGGEGKTLLAFSLGKAAKKGVFADCDVTMPNLHLLLDPAIKSEGVFLSDKSAVLNMRVCNQCGDCFRACRFGAVREGDVPEGWLYSIDSLACEGCGVCVRVCPQGALDLATSPGGAWYVADSSLGPLVYAALAPGQRNPSGLVRIVRREAQRVANREGLACVVIDAPAGAGASTTAAIAGASLAVVVAEPTVSGAHGLVKLLDLAKRHAGVTVGVINKYDIDSQVSGEIQDMLESRSVNLVGKIPFSPDLRRAYAGREFAADLGDDPAAEEIRAIVDRIHALAQVS